MPVKNAEPFLTECLESILSQSEFRWELIAVDDHSSDNSHNILQQFAQRDKRIQVLSNKASGIIEALRLAYANSNGNFITRMDADDKMATDKLHILKQNLLANGTGHLGVGQVKYFSDTELKGGYKYYESWLNGLTANGTNYADIYRECVIPSPCWMVYRADLDKCHAFEPNTYPEDYDLCFRFYQHGLKPIACSTLLHYWRDYPERTSRNDPNYADNRFLKLKLEWFLKLNHQPDKPLVVWGASSKGKELARRLIMAKVDFHWICNNPNKIGKQVYDLLIENTEKIRQLKNPQVIVAVANKNDQAEIKAQLNTEGVFFFC